MAWSACVPLCRFVAPAEFVGNPSSRSSTLDSGTALVLAANLALSNITAAEKVD